MHLNILVSNLCFVYCHGCYSCSRDNITGELLSTTLLLDFLSFIKNHGIDKITLCGGDPLTRPDFMALLEGIHSLGLSVSLDTVGTTLIRDIRIGNKLYEKINIAHFASMVDIVGIPIDGSTDEICRKFRNSPEYRLKEQLEICNRLHQAGANVCINTVVHKGNLLDVAYLAELISGLPCIQKWQLFQYSPSGKYGKKNRKIFQITEDEFCGFAKDLVTHIKNEKLKLEFKSLRERNNLYMMVDTDGNAWIPEFNVDDSTNTSRNIIGNIKDPNDWSIILQQLVS